MLENLILGPLREMNKSEIFQIVFKILPQCYGSFSKEFLTLTVQTYLSYTVTSMKINTHNSQSLIFIDFDINHYYMVSSVSGQDESNPAL